MIPTLLFAILSVTATARPEAPKLEEPSIDAKIFDKSTPEEFFEKRREDAKCVEDLDKAEKKHGELRKALRALMKERDDKAGSQKEDEAKRTRLAVQPKIDKAEKEWLAARAALLPLVEKCGPCATRPVEYRKVTGTSGAEHWYIADGSCWVGKTNQYEDASKAFEKINRYPRRLDGFTALLEFAPFDKDGTAIPEDKNLPIEDAIDPTFVFLALRADPGLGFTMAWTHLFQSEFRKRDEGRWIVMQTPGKDVTVPEIAEPELVDRALSGKEATVKRFKVRKAFGTWYVTRDGYVRYNNSGDFGGPVLFLDREGRKLVQDVLYEMVERMRGT